MPEFDEEMQANIASYPLDERYEPLPVASALEMAVWKLVRCARELVMYPNEMINDAEWNDLLGVLKVQGNRLNLTHFTRWAQRLGAGHLLPLALDDAGLTPPEAPPQQLLAG
jgi:hypothetical protein